MSHATLSSSLVLVNDQIQSPPRPESCEVDELGVAICISPPENTSEEPLGSDEAGARSQCPPGDPEGASAPPSVVIDVPPTVVQLAFKCSDLASLLPRRIMGSSLDARLPWGNVGDECVICLGEMAADEEVSDLPPCNHTFHLQCAVHWLTTNIEAGRPGCCPVCNAEILHPVLKEVIPPVAPRGCRGLCLRFYEWQRPTEPLSPLHRNVLIMIVVSCLVTMIAFFSITHADY
ncbi:hypothetical protein T484DRAFT_1812214 [Baffinella frigidus]|nr:hypothetical protein T484DRAFT_1812214 [Cryptophyta sp. CCMP2293]|mmetsp:Transcript_26062/g.61908  ORF Transcript_26062/g.61908 Transcript_26062/m.61908 type:complete len:233 (-) Transcript_26062:65-763(-)